ncbi:MAG: DUF86 domain-containing protein [Mangrovibacterium sp.]
MYDKKLALETISLIVENLVIVQQRTEHIDSTDDFISSAQGMILLDSVCMKLVAVGESIKNLDKLTHKELLIQYPQVAWKQAMGMRDIIVHHYFDIDAEQIFDTLKEDIPLLLHTLTEMKAEISQTI